MDDDLLQQLGAILRALRAAAAASHGTAGIGTTQGQFLREIARHPQTSQAELARLTDTDPALTGRVLENLIERGWVARKKSADDARRYVLTLTAAGRRVVKTVEEARAALTERLKAGLDDEDLDDLARVTQKIVALLETPPSDNAPLGTVRASSRRRRP